jgi:heavy metal translocating P-type ATPase
VRAVTATLKALGVTPVTAALRREAWRLIPFCCTFLAVAFAGNFWAQVPSRAWAETAGAVSRFSACAVYLLMGLPALEDLAYNAANLKLNIHVLTMLSVFGTIFLGRPLEGALLLLLFAAAGLLEDQLSMAARGDLNKLFTSAPSHALVVEDLNCLEAAQSLPVDDLPVGTLTVVKAGEQVPLDGVVVSGGALVSMELITGESMPVGKGVGDELPAGSENHDGVLVVRSTRTSAQSTPAAIARLTMSAQKRRPRLQARLHMYTDLYSKIVLTCSLAIAALLPFFGLTVFGPTGSVYRAAVFLTASAPCAMVMAPIAYVAAIGAIARRGVLVRGGRVLDVLSTCRTVALDKTGTLTTGDLVCTDILPLEQAHQSATVGGGSAGEGALRALSVASSLSQRANHPISAAVVARAKREASRLEPIEVDEYRVLPGSGVEGAAFLPGSAAPAQVRFGSTQFVSEVLSSGAAAKMNDVATRCGNRGSVSALAILDPEGAQGGGSSAREENVHLFIFSDTVREKSLAAVNEIQAAPWRMGAGPGVIMLTGDNKTSADKVAQKLGISDVFSELSPQEKLEIVEERRAATGGGVAMVGDGINDAPALAAADVGIAVAPTPTAAAASAADVILLSEGDNISSLPYVLEVAERTRAVVAQNVVLAATSILGTAVAAIGGLVPLWLAVILHEGSTLLVALNSLRLLVPPKEEKPEGENSRVVFYAALVCLAITAAILGVLYYFGLNHPVIHGCGSGLIAGFLHTLTGPDHLAALTPLAIGQPGPKAMFLGGLWGMGHNSGQLLLGAAFLLLKSRIPFNMAVIEQWAGVAVGITLTIIGWIGFMESREPASEEDTASPEGVEMDSQGRAKLTWGTFATGVVHGLQPDSMFLLLPAFAMASKVAAGAFLACFLAGTVIAMGSYSAFLSIATMSIGKRAPGFNNAISKGSSFIAIGLGIVIIVSAVMGVEIIALH